MDYKTQIGVGFGVLILNEQNQVLLGQRHVDPEKADSELAGEGTWTMPGGKMEYGETFEECAIRETKEETDIDITNLKILCVNNDVNEHAHFVTIGTQAVEFSGEPKVMEPDEITQWEWFDLDDLPEPLFFPSKKLLDNYHANAFYLS